MPAKDAASPALRQFLNKLLEFDLRKGDLMKSSVRNTVMALGLVAIGVAIGGAGIYIGDTDDAPGAALMGILLMIGTVALGVRTARRKT